MLIRLILSLLLVSFSFSETIPNGQYFIDLAKNGNREEVLLAVSKYQTQVSYGRIALKSEAVYYLRPTSLWRGCSKFCVS